MLDIMADLILLHWLKASEINNKLIVKSHTHTHTLLMFYYFQICFLSIKLMIQSRIEVL